MTALAPALALAGSDLELLELLGSELLDPASGYRLPSTAPDGCGFAPSLRVDSPLAERAVEAGALELRDPDTTPLALLSIEADEPAQGGGRWLAGTITPLRPPEHGPARSRRLHRATKLDTRLVAIFGGEIRPADVLHVAMEASGRPVALVAEGSADTAESTRLVGTLEACARELPDAIVHYVPHIHTDEAANVDVTRLVLEGVGALVVIDVRRHITEVKREGAVILLTGLSGSGKSTIARAVTEHLRLHTDQKVVLLDGDHVRSELASELTFSAGDRDRNLQRQAWVAARVAEAGGLAICAPIAPFASSRASMRAKVEPDFRFLLVHVSTPITVAEQRDRKGLYAKARAGLIPDFTGVDSPYEVPEDADLSIDTAALTVEEATREVISLLERRGLL